jgi:glycine oxidase
VVDFIIVGRGLAACVLMHRFYQNGITFRVVGRSDLSTCSRVAAGIWNPVVFKRMTMSWMAPQLVASLKSFYGDCGKLLQKDLITLRPIIKPFTEEQEKEHWLKKAKGPLNGLLDDKIHDPAVGLQNLHVLNGYGKVLESGNLNVPGFIDGTVDFFREVCLDETFYYEDLEIHENKVEYQHLEAGNIIFCEGHLVSKNPWFNWTPLKPAKGEILTLRCPRLGLQNSIFNRDGFLMDTPGNEFKLGATYNWKELNDRPSAEGREELLTKFSKMSSISPTIIKHEAGVRPSSPDRRPIIGRHPLHANLYIFNGLGAKGVMLAPFFSGNFVLFYLKKEELHPEVDVRRFFPEYDRQKK